MLEVPPDSLPHTPCLQSYPGVLNWFTWEDSQSSSLFLCSPRYQNCWVSWLDLGPLFSPGPKLLLWDYPAPSCADCQAVEQVFLILSEQSPHVVILALFFLFWPHWTGHSHPSCRKLPHTCTLLFVLLHNKSHRWPHPFLTGPIFQPFIMFVA